MSPEQPDNKPNPLKIALVTEEAAGIRLLRSLSASAHNISYVFCADTSETGNGVSVWSIAKDLELNAVPVDQLKLPAMVHELREANIDLLISVRSPAILSDEVIASPRLGAFNLHTGPLPAYAGRNVISWAIFNGETSHGVTLHRLTAEIDGGNIVYKTQFPIEENDTALDITGRSIKEGISLVNKLIDQVAIDPSALPEEPQDIELRQYYDKSIPNRGSIDWGWEANHIDQFVRACNFYPLPSPWGHPKAIIGNQSVQILSVHRIFEPTKETPGTLKISSAQEVLIACKDEWIAIDDVIIDGNAQEAFLALTPA